MSIPTKSYLKVQYDLRPAKQVERRMLIDALQTLAFSGLQICDYQYTGFGSIHFVDFILFHKFLGIKKMLSIEHDRRIRKRVNFNKPYDSVEIKIGSAEKYIPKLSKDKKHILWLDYDTQINAEILSDFAMAISHLSVGSIILITVDAHPPGAKEDKNYGPKLWRDHYFSVAEQYVGSYSNVSDFEERHLGRINVEILNNVIKEGLSSRPDVKFYPLFNFSYADGHQMITCGGMIGSESEKRFIDGGSLRDKSYIRLDLSKPPFEIFVPKVTRKERFYLDSNMPCSTNWRPQEFEFSKQDIKAYREIYRYFPAYAEMML